MRKSTSALLVTITALFVGTEILAQADSAWQKEPKITLSGFADVFYVFDFNEPAGTERQPFLFNHNRHNEFNLNLGLVQMNVRQEKYRANFAIQTGVYANDNYAAEPGLLKNIFEANIGFSLNKKNSLWLDAGVMPSHLGFESAISIDNPTLTRSLCAESSPYFLSGAKLSFTPNEKWELAGLVVNGWQRIQRLQGNSLPSFGTQVNYSPNEDLTLNWSTFVGTDDPDAFRRMRYFNNMYGIFHLSEKITFITGFDIGIQQRTKGSDDYDYWYTPVIIGQYIINKNWKTAFRAEYFQDETGIIIPTGTQNNFNTAGVSLNIDYSPTPKLLWRIEGRWFNSEDPIFVRNRDRINDNVFIGTSIAIRFSENLRD